MSTGDGVVGGGFVLKKRFVVHHLSRPNGSSSCCPGLCPQLNKLDNNKKGQNWSPAACLVLPQKPRDVSWRAAATKPKKTKKRRCAKMKLRPSPCANFAPVGATTSNLYQRSASKTGMSRVSPVMVNLTPFPSSQLVLWHQNSRNLSSQHPVTQLEVRKAFFPPFCLDCHKRRIMWRAAVAPLRTERLLKATADENKRLVVWLLHAEHCGASLSTYMYI